MNTLFQISLNQKNCILFEGANGNQSVPCLWTNYFDDDLLAVEYFYHDYETASSVTSSFDSQVSEDSMAAGGQDYLSLTSLAVRQAWGALEWVNSPEQPWVRVLISLESQSYLGYAHRGLACVYIYFAEIET